MTSKTKPQKNLEGEIESKIKHTIQKYKLCNKQEKVIVALSGGKDSTTTAYFFKKLGYKIEGFHINLGLGEYSKDCLDAVKELCKNLEIKLYVYDVKKEMGSGMCYLRTTIQSKQNVKLKNCAVCGVLKKWIMNKEIKKLFADKIATGHNLDDEAQTFLMNIFKGSPQLSANTGAITKNISDKKFIPRIKPLFYVFEEDIRKFSKEKKLPVVYEKCPCALDSYRIQIRQFVNTLSKKEKENIIKNFDELSEKLQKVKDKKMNYCEICGEPARNKICKRCELIG